MASFPIPSAPEYNQLPPPYEYPVMQEPFSFRAADNLLKFSATLEGADKPSAIDQELAELIKSRSLDPIDTKIFFERDIEKIELVLSSSGDVVRYARTGGNKMIDRDHRPAEMLTKSPLANYTFVSLSLPPRTAEPPAAPAPTPDVIKAPGKALASKIDVDPKTIATAIIASYIGFSNLAIASLVNFGADKFTEGKVPLTAKNVFVAGTILALTPTLLLEALLIGGVAVKGYQIAQQPDGIKHALEKATEVKDSVLEGSKTALKMGAELVSNIASVWNMVGINK